MKENLMSFISEIANLIVNPNGKASDPYDVNVNNNYVSLYQAKKSLKDIDIPIEKIVQDKRSRKITIETSANLNSDQSKKVAEYFDENRIGYDLNGNRLNSFTIDKNSKCVLEERQWK